MQTLQVLLAEKKQNMEKEYPQWNQKRDEWIANVDNLFRIIKNWLKPLEEKDYLKISSEDISLSEKLIGRYSLKKMIVTFFNNEKIEFRPVGLHIIGANGRVDMKLGMRTIMIVGNSNNTGWMFSEREGRGKPRTWNFDEDSFNAILTEFVEAF